MNELEELIEEVFTHFGAAYCHSEVLHRTLCITFAMATFERAEDITGPRIEEKLSLAFSLTLGQVAEKSKELFPCDLQEKLQIAVDKRNYLAHHFWFERCHLMFSQQTLREQRQELIEFREFFNRLDETITKYFKSKFQSLGLTDELIQESFAKLMAGEIEEPFISQRLPKKQERIVRVWDVKVGDKQKTQIFETEDGCLWQLSDVGLGWTRFEKPLSDWSINESLQKYLPAMINPRPPIAEPWTYEFNLAKGVVFWVKRGSREKSYKMGIKKPSKS